MCQAASVPASRPCIWIKRIRWEMGEFYELSPRFFLATFDLLILWNIFYGLKKNVHKTTFFKQEFFCPSRKAWGFLFSQTCFVLVNSSENGGRSCWKNGKRNPKCLEIANFFQCICDKHPFVAKKIEQAFFEICGFGCQKEET